MGSLRVFIAVAHHLSFTRAADALGVTASAASLQIRSLEEYLARPLFRRNGRQVVLTTEAEALLPRLERFRVACPAVNLHLHTSEEKVDFVREDFHAAVRFGRGGYSNVYSEKLMDEWLVPVCAPALYRKFGPLREANDLRRYPLLHSVSDPWTIWLFDGHSADDGTPLRGAVFDAEVALVRMAEQAAGLVLARWSLVAEQIASGKLVRASTRALRLDEGYWLVCPARARALPSVKGFMDWIRKEAAGFSHPIDT